MASVAKKLGISEQSIYRWHKRFGTFQANEVKRICRLEAENAPLKKLVADFVAKVCSQRSLGRAVF